MVDTVIAAEARELLVRYGQQLRKAREQRWVSLRELDELVGIRYSDLSRIEAGRICPTTEQAQILHDWVLQHPVVDDQG